MTALSVRRRRRLFQRLAPAPWEAKRAAGHPFCRLCVAERPGAQWEGRAFRRVVVDRRASCAEAWVRQRQEGERRGEVQAVPHRAALPVAQQIWEPVPRPGAAVPVFLAAPPAGVARQLRAVRFWVAATGRSPHLFLEIRRTVHVVPPVLVRDLPAPDAHTPAARSRRSRPWRCTPATSSCRSPVELCRGRRSEPENCVAAPAKLDCVVVVKGTSAA